MHLGRIRRRQGARSQVPEVGRVGVAQGVPHNTRHIDKAELTNRQRNATLVCDTRRDGPCGLYSTSHFKAWGHLTQTFPEPSYQNITCSSHFPISWT